MLESGSNINQINNFGYTALIYLLKQESYKYRELHLDVIHKMINLMSIESLNSSTEDGMSALFISINTKISNFNNLSTKLIEKGVNLNIFYKDVPIIFKALGLENKEKALELIKNGVNLEIVYSDETPLINIIKKILKIQSLDLEFIPEIIKKLIFEIIKRPCKPEYIQTNGETALIMSSHINKDEEIFLEILKLENCLEEHQVKHPHSETYISALNIALLSGKFESCKAIIRKNYKVLKYPINNENNILSQTLDLLIKNRENLEKKREYYEILQLMIDSESLYSDDLSNLSWINTINNRTFLMEIINWSVEIPECLELTHKILDDVRLRNSLNINNLDKNYNDVLYYAISRKLFYVALKLLPKVARHNRIYQIDYFKNYINGKVSDIKIPIYLTILLYSFYQISKISKKIIESEYNCKDEFIIELLKYDCDLEYIDSFGKDALYLSITYDIKDEVVFEIIKKLPPSSPLFGNILRLLYITEDKNDVRKNKSSLFQAILKKKENIALELIKYDTTNKLAYNVHDDFPIESYVLKAFISELINVGVELIRRGFDYPDLIMSYNYTLLGGILGYWNKIEKTIFKDELQEYIIKYIRKYPHFLSIYNTYDKIPTGKKIAGYTALMWSLTHKNIELVMEILKYEESIPEFVSPYNGRSALIILCFQDIPENMDIFNEIIRRGSPINNKTDLGNTPLIVSCKHKNINYARELIKMETNITNIKHKNNEKEDALGWAIKNNMEEIAELIREKIRELE